MATKRRGIVKRRDIKAEQTFYTDELKVDDALNRVMSIYSSEGYRERTMSDYESYWKEFIRIVQRKYILDVTTDDFRKFINILLRKRGLSPVTVNIRMNAIRAIFNRLFAEGLLGNENPVAPIRKLKTDQNKVGALTDDQIRRLFAQIDKDSFAGYRNYVAMLTMLKCGLRINEINVLEVEDVDFDNGVIALPGAKNKNRKNRTVPMAKKVSEELKQLIYESNEYFGKSRYVFVNNSGEPLAEDLIRKRMHQYGNKAGLKGECRYSPHNLRHSFAVNFLKNGGDIRTLQMILGHSDLTTTQIYLNYNDVDLKEKYESVQMRDKLNV
ncbi:tyrosine-type recombinase/integrase [Bacillus sp. PAMC26568]|nr:tyrosine-type recombinase/integrase [Bacillus sp. PAMC26568]